jgi:hypothetical protein
MFGHKISVTSEAPAKWQQMLADSAKPRTGLHVTDLIGCPRKRALLAEGAEQDVMRLKAVTWGSLLHKGYGTDERKVSMTLGGYDLVGSIDLLADEGIVVADLKFPNAEGFIRKVASKSGMKFPEAEHVWQVEMYRLGLLQEGVLTSGGAIHYGAHSSGKWPAWVTCEWTGAVADEEALLDFQPLDGPYSVRQIAAYCGQPVDSIPLVGSTWPFGDKGKTACDWCAVELSCKLRASVAPREEAF